MVDQRKGLMDLVTDKSMKAYNWATGGNRYDFAIETTGIGLTAVGLESMLLHSYIQIIAVPAMVFGSYIFGKRVNSLKENKSLEKNTSLEYKKGRTEEKRLIKLFGGVGLTVATIRYLSSSDDGIDYLELASLAADLSFPLIAVSVNSLISDSPELKHKKGIIGRTVDKFKGKSLEEI